MSRAGGTGVRPDDEAMLNAYVDGELGADEAAALALRAAGEPALAARIAALHQMKAGVVMLQGEAPPLPPMAKLPPMPAPGSAPRRHRRGLMAAGALALVSAVAAAVAVLTLVLLERPASHQPDDLAVQPAAAPVVAFGTAASVIDPALVSHDAWVAAYRPGAASLDAPSWLEAPMQAAGLRLVHLEPGRAGALHHGFTGSNDCRLSLFETAITTTGPAEERALRLSLEPSLLRAEWRVQGRAYEMLARDMSRTRFIAIATALHDVSRERRVAGERLLAGLEASRLPCTA
ncbi:MAG: hypothetical protein JJT95_05630 [Pararhodobacter sp.]|nr:hypothetical protein [Pararhodobacter sp.]